LLALLFPLAAVNNTARSRSSLVVQSNQTVVTLPDVDFDSRFCKMVGNP
jgi:hypothetical protein